MAFCQLQLQSTCISTVTLVVFSFLAVIFSFCAFWQFGVKMQRRGGGKRLRLRRHMPRHMLRHKAGRAPNDNANMLMLSR